MKAWIGLALVAVSGGSIALLIYLRRRWLARARVQINAAIAEQKQGLYYTFLGHDESLDVTARLRRDIADRKRRQAAAVTSGGTSADVREIARRA